MPSMSDAGLSGEGNFIKPAELAATERVFEIIGAQFREAHGDFKDQINYEIRFLDDPTATTYRFSLEANEARRPVLDFFREHPGEVLDAVKSDVAQGIVLYKGANTGKGQPYLFRDATDEEYSRAQTERIDNAAQDEIPF
jgi:hypothetical protein